MWHLFDKGVPLHEMCNVYIRLWEGQIHTSTRPMPEQLGSACRDFHEIRYFCIFRKYVDKIENIIKNYIKTYLHLWKYIDQLFLEWKWFRQICRENQKTHFMVNNFFQKIVTFCYNVQISYRTSHDTDDWRMIFTSWITRTTNKNSEYVIHTVSPLQQWLQERSSLLR